MAFLRRKHVDALMEGVATGLATELKFFHWPLEFPTVFQNAADPDIVIGNPPWERIKLQEEEHWVDDAFISGSANKAERTRRLNQYRNSSDPKLLARFSRFESAKHASEATGRFVRGSSPFSTHGGWRREHVCPVR